MARKSEWFSLEHGDQLSFGGERFRFRQDPVPGKHISWKDSPRHYRTVRELRAHADKESAAYGRAGRLEQLSRIFELYRVSERSWKSHRKHQWKDR